jgi:RNA polymerase sigma factor (sigma-70 family)
MTEKPMEKEFEAFLARFMGFIRANIGRFNIQRFGIDPDDIVQEVRIKIWKLLESEKNVVNYSSYIKKIVNSSVIDQIRKLRREEQVFQAEMQKQVAEREDAYKQEFLRNSIRKEIVGLAVESLIESRKNVVKLYLLNMGIEEISRYYGWTPHKTRNLLYRGLSDLRKILKNKSDDHENP